MGRPAPPARRRRPGCGLAGRSRVLHQPGLRPRRAGRLGRPPRPAPRVVPAGRPAHARRPPSTVPDLADRGWVLVGPPPLMVRPARRRRPSGVPAELTIARGRRRGRPRGVRADTGRRTTPTRRCSRTGGAASTTAGCSADRPTSSPASSPAGRWPPRRATSPPASTWSRWWRPRPGPRARLRRRRDLGGHHASTRRCPPC